jgi:hypothetical protein
MWSYYDWVYCCCRPSVNIICGRIMIGLSLLSSVSKHNSWSYYDWGQPNHNTTTYCVYGRTTTTINTIIIRPHCLFTDRRQQRQPNLWSYYDWVYCCCRPSVNIICGRIMIGLSLSSVRKHNMSSCNDWVAVVVFRLFTDGRQQRQPNHNTTTYCVY